MFNLEFSYGGHEYDHSGIVCVDVGNSAGLTLKEQIPVGITYYTEDEIDDVIYSFGDFWWGSQYEPFNQNCNCFTEKFISHIVHNGEYYYPSYINRFTKLGSLLSMWFKPLQATFGNVVDYNDDEDEVSRPPVNSSSAQLQQQNVDNFNPEVMVAPLSVINQIDVIQLRHSQNRSNIVFS